MKKEHLKSFRFSFAKQVSCGRPKISTPVPDQILNRLRLRLQLKNLGSNRLRVRNTAFLDISSPRYLLIMILP